jgi:hypothetical protein
MQPGGNQHGILHPMQSRVILQGSVPLRLLDCFLLATAGVSDTCAAFLPVASDGRALFLLTAGVPMAGPSSGASRANEGEAMVSVSAIGRGGGERGRSAPASSGGAALQSKQVARRQKNAAVGTSRGQLAVAI